MTGLFERRTSDDFVVALMLYFKGYVVTVPWVEHSIDATWEKGPLQNAEEFVGMVTKCSDCVSACLTDENCKACVDALNAVDTRDQVASYRTVVSYKSPLLTDFSMCILQRNNVFRCDTTIPETKAGPMSTWRGGRALTQDDARGILIGHLNDEDAIEVSRTKAPTTTVVHLEVSTSPFVSCALFPVHRVQVGKRTDASWKVACGANVAYDQFPSQNQVRTWFAWCRRVVLLAPLLIARASDHFCSSHRDAALLRERKRTLHVVRSGVSRRDHRR